MYYERLIKKAAEEQVMNLTLPLALGLGEAAYGANLGSMQKTNMGLFDKLKAITPVPVKTIKDGIAPNSHFNPSTAEVGIAEAHMGKPGILAHELGHARSILGKNFDGKISLFGRIGKDLGMASRQIGPLSGGVALLAGILQGDKMSDKELAALGTAGAIPQIPMLASELKASAHGASMLRRLGFGRFKALSSFVGIPTYLSGTALPFIPYLSRKLSKND